MKVCPISVRPSRSYLNNTYKRVSNYSQKQESPDTNQTKNIAFKSNEGAAVGIIAGALTGVVLTGLTVATGGLAGIVAAVGTTQTLVGGAAAGTHLGGIIGGLVTK